MSKNAKKFNILKTNISGAVCSLKTRKRGASVFEDDNFEFDNSVEPDEWDKVWNGQPSTLDNVDLEEEYHKTFCGNKDKQRASPKKKSIFEENDDEFIINEKTEVTTFVPLEPQSAAHLAEDNTEAKGDEDKEVENLALEIAEDFIKEEHITLVGEAIYRYDGRFYSLLNTDEAQRLIFARYRKDVERKNIASVIKNVIFLLRVCTSKQYDEFPVNSGIIVFQNGTLEVATENFRKNSPKDLTSSALGIDFERSCWKMPYTNHFLKTIADGDDDLYELMLQVIGYILSNDIKAKSFFYLEGVGDAGKSRFCDLISSFFPTVGANKVARIALQDLGGKFALGNLVNTKLNISEDLPDAPLSPTTVSRIKMISDANRLEAEAKYVQPFSFRPTCKLLFASNHPLRLKEYDAAFVNRVVYIPFMHAIPKHKQDKNILEKMQRELPALFNHAFKAYKRLVSNGYIWAGADRFKPEIAIVGSGISIDKQQTIKQFVNICCEFKIDSITSTAELQEAYNKFCYVRQYNPIMGDRFSRELFAVLPADITRVKIGNQRRGFKGIRLKNID